jgi:DNA invertase Pin-like site-specific DNA recombinase
MKGIIYVTVTCGMQDENRLSIATRIERLSAYVKEHGIEVVGQFCVQGVSLGSRVKLLNAIAGILKDSPDIETLICPRMDSSFRGVAELEIANELVNKYNKTLIFCEDNSTISRRSSPKELFAWDTRNAIARFLGASLRKLNSNKIN